MNNQNTVRIPTALALLMILIITVVFGFGMNIVSNKRVKASKTVEPKYVEVSNISDIGFTISWMTQDKATGAVIVSGPELKSKTYFDERDTDKGQKMNFSHSIRIQDIKPETEYTIQILSNGSQTGTKPMIVKTAPVLSDQPSGLEPAYGAALTPDNTAAIDSLVYITLENSQKLSTIVHESGSWLIPLNLIRTKDLTSYIKPNPRIDEQILIRNSADVTSAVTDTLNDSPVPAMIIGKSYDFRKQQAVNNPPKSLAQLETVVSDTPAILGKQSEHEETSKDFAITQPEENASLVSNLPLFKGKGLPNAPVNITIGIKDPITASVYVGSDKIWQYVPKKPLPAGRQSITVSSKNENGKTVAITRMFDILKSGTQVLGTATPSASLAPSPTTGNIPTVIPTTPIPQPTVEYVEPTPTLEIITTPPVSGSPTTLYAIIGVSIFFLLSGVVLAFL